MKPITLTRFNALAGYCRQPMTLHIAEEVGWFEHANERVLGTVILDDTDGDYSGVTLAKDQMGRFRSVHLTDFYPSAHWAKALLRREMERLSMASDEEYYQGDEEGEPLNLFTPIVDTYRLNPGFIALADTPEYFAGREIITPMMHWYEDLDGNFVEQFQSTGFNARIWELYLFATFVEMGYRIENIHATPDFTCDGVLGKFSVEAVTVNPTLDRTGEIVPPPPIKTDEERWSFLREYMPIKFGSSLTSKLAKRYWEKPNVAGKPLIFAIEDFSSLGSMVHTRSALPVYLFGYDHDWERDENGGLRITPRKIQTHKWGGKVIPSGFFDLPDSENVSAVLFSNSGTISKFNRMGVLAGFGSTDVILIRQGTAVNHDPNATEPQKFKHLVNSPEYQESWGEGLDIFHNPNANHPIEPEMLPGAAHHWLLPDGQIESTIPEWHPLGSITLIAKRPDDK